MQYILSSQEMKQCDKNTSEHFKIPSIVLMERAAVAFVETLRQKKVDVSKPLIVCGTGNNGGDGLAIARLLALAGAEVTVVLAGDSKKATEENKLQQEILEAYQIPVQNEITGQAYTVVIDALFGVGLTRNIEGELAQMIMQMNQCTGTKAAVDISSGVSADSGKILGTAFWADITVTFAFAKTGMLLFPGSGYSGEVVVKEIGIDTHSFLEEMPKLCALEQSDIRKLLPRRWEYSNKGTYGKLLLIAGSVNMAGRQSLRQGRLMPQAAA